MVLSDPGGFARRPWSSGRPIRRHVDGRIGIQLPRDLEDSELRGYVTARERIPWKEGEGRGSCFRRGAAVTRAQERSRHP